MFDIQFAHGSLTNTEFENGKTLVRSQRAGSIKGPAERYWRAELDHGDHHPYYKAVAYAKLGEKDKAIEKLEQAFAEHYSGMVWLKVTPELDPLRGDPHFEAIVKKVGL